MRKTKQRIIGREREKEKIQERNIDILEHGEKAKVGNEGTFF